MGLSRGGDYIFILSRGGDSNPTGGTEFLKFHGGQIRHKVQNHPIKDYNIRFGNSTWEVIFFKHITF